MAKQQTKAEKAETVAAATEEAEGTFPPESVERLAAIDPAAEIEALKEQAQQTTPKRGRKSKAAAEAEQTLELTGVLLPVLGGLNGVVAGRLPEFRHSPEEIQTLAVLIGKVLAKHVDTAVAKYGDEIILATYLAGSLTEKGYAYYRRRQLEEAGLAEETKNGRTSEKQ